MFDGTLVDFHGHVQFGRILEKRVYIFLCQMPVGFQAKSGRPNDERVLRQILGE